MKNHAACFFGRACFAAGTPGGWAAIETLRVGDLVLSRDEHDAAGPVGAKVVEEVFRRVGCMWEVRAGGQLIETTGEHPFYAAATGWTAARELSVGDQLVCEDGSSVVVEGVRDTGRWAAVYNLRVADHHTYFVGKDEWGLAAWAHNVYIFRGDINHVPKSGPIGQPFDPAISDADLAQMAYDHVGQKLGHASSLFKSWTSKFAFARDVFADGRADRVTKVNLELLAPLVEAGLIRIYDPDQVRQLIRNHGGNKISKEANDILAAMIRSKEVLILG